MIGWWFLFLLTLKETKNLIHDKIVFEVDNFIQMCTVLRHSVNPVLARILRVIKILAFGISSVYYHVSVFFGDSNIK